jgi:hypothetical protein
MSHIQIFVLVVGILTIIGVVVSFLKKSAIYSGYEDIKHDVPTIAHALKGEIFRDGDDLVIAGNHKKFPVQVRFSYSENTAGMNIRMQAPVSFTLSVVPKGERATEGRVLVRTGDDMFDAKFATRTDHPTQAKMVVGSKPMRTHMEKLCCSSKTFLTMVRGSIEVSELLIPSNAGRHVVDHLESMAILGALVQDIPGAETVKIAPYKREQSAPVVRIALAVGAIATIIAVFVVKPTSSQPDLSSLPKNEAALAGSNPIEAPLLGDTRGYHVATEEDFDNGVANWVKGYGLDASGRIPLDLDGKEETQDVAYWLVGPDGKNRISILSAGNNVYDTVYQNVVGVTAIPNASFSGIRWANKPVQQPDGDVILLVMKNEDGTFHGMVLYPKFKRPYTAVPQDYTAISLSR